MPFTFLISSLISASSGSLLEKNFAVVCIRCSSSLTSTVSLARFACTSGWSNWSLAVCAVAVMPPSPSSMKTAAYFNEVRKSFFIISSSYLVLIANDVCLGNALSLALSHVQFRAHHAQCEYQLFLLREFLRR